MLLTTSLSVHAQTSPEPDPSVHAWLLPTCPSTDAQARLSPILTGLLVSAAGGVIDWLGSALDEAAKADKEGKATKGTSPAYLWWHNGQSGERKLMSCMVVTLSNSDPESWCNRGDSPFKNDGAICKYFADKDAPVNKTPGLTPANWVLGTSLPAFYAEIQLEAATDKRGVLPKLVTLYYAKGIHGRKFSNNKPRTLQISVAAATPEGSSALSSTVIRVENIAPDTQIRTGTDIPAAGGRVWAAALAIPEKYTPPEGGGAIIPVNVSAEIREIGDPNLFLQALAKAFASQKDALKEQAKAQIAAATAEVDPAAVQSTYDAQAAAVYAAEAKVRNACRPNPPATRNPSAVRSEYLGLLEAHRKLAAVPSPAQKIDFSPDQATLESLHSSSADDICLKFP
jgi:hypothetical protein